MLLIRVPDSTRTERETLILESHAYNTLGTLIETLQKRLDRSL